MEKSNEYIEKRIKWRAERNQLPSLYSFDYSELNKNEKLNLDNLLRDFDLGIPALFFKGEENSWTVVGTKMIACGNKEQVKAIAYSDIKVHTIGDDPYNEFPEVVDKEGFNELSQHKILLRGNDEQILMLNAKQNGKEIFALYNILIMLLRMYDVEEF